MKTALLAASLLCLLDLSAASTVEWRGSRPWAGPETWANPLYDWKVEHDELVAVAGPNHTLHHLTHQVADPARGFETSVTLRIDAAERISQPGSTWAGFAFGLQGLMDDYRHRLAGSQRRINAGLRADGRIFLGAEIATEVLGGPPGEAATLTLKFDGRRATLHASRGTAATSVALEVNPAAAKGNLALAAESSRKPTDKRGPIRVHFGAWQLRGDGYSVHPSQVFGPILWSQYTLARGILKLSAQFAPIGAGDAQSAALDLAAGNGWREVSTAAIDPLARTALFRVEGWKTSPTPVRYRVRYAWQGRDHYWEGSIRPEPGEVVKIGVFSCDHGYAFPLPAMTAQVAAQDPDLLYFAGDQIYEVYGGFGIVRSPVETAMLDYLRKYYQFGWTWRDLLKDRPSVIIPDDHDVFQGNLWGAGGRPLPVPLRFSSGGYAMPPAWIKAVERTQTAHLPDPAHSEPIAQGLTTYYTAFELGGLPIAVLEDRKFKSGPDQFRDSSKKGRNAVPAAAPGADLLGARQEKFLTAWAERTRDAPLRLVLSQTIFCTVHTHAGTKLTRGGLDFDSNGWPKSGRDRVLRALANNRHTLMLHGDQHLGILLRQGLERFDDGPLAFMVPGTANGFPRAWWPNEERKTDPATWTGPFTDVLGNKFTVLGAANPTPGSNTLNPRGDDDPETTAFSKGSGHGLVIIDRRVRRTTFEMWRYARPAPAQFTGFPVTLDW